MIRTVILIGWLLVALFLKISSFISLSFGLVLLVLASLSMITNHQGFGLRLTTYAFGFFVIGFISYIREIIYNGKN